MGFTVTGKFSENVLIYNKKGAPTVRHEYGFFK
jgi:hypothetical protein